MKTHCEKGRDETCEVRWKWTVKPGTTDLNIEPVERENWKRDESIEKEKDEAVHWTVAHVV